MTAITADLNQVRLGTRGSLLATTQSGTIRDALCAAGLPTQLKIISTPGDRSQAPVATIGVGVFTQALRAAMAAGECDIAVHSFKDLPTAPDPRFHLVVPGRVNPSEALISRHSGGLSDLPLGATVGTSAPRRLAQLQRWRPDLNTVPLRGNIDTRLGKVHSGELDAIILAAAGLERVGRLGEASEILAWQTLLPAPAQGCLAVECRVSDPELVAALDALADPLATWCAVAERTVLEVLEAGCTAPIGALARETAPGQLTLDAALFEYEGQWSPQQPNWVQHTLAVASMEQARALGTAVAREILARR